MTTTRKAMTEAERLANALDRAANYELKEYTPLAAAELRRLQAEIEALRTARVQEPVLVVDVVELRKLLAQPEGDKHIRAWPARDVFPSEVALYTAPQPVQEPAPNHLQDIAAYIGVGGCNGATDEQLAKRICDEFTRLTAKLLEPAPGYKVVPVEPTEYPAAPMNAHPPCSVLHGSVPA